MDGINLGIILGFCFLIIVIAIVIAIIWIVLSSPKGGQAVDYRGSPAVPGKSQTPDFTTAPDQPVRGGVYDPRSNVEQQ